MTPFPGESEAGTEGPRVETAHGSAADFRTNTNPCDTNRMSSKMTADGAVSIHSVIDGESAANGGGEDAILPSGVMQSFVRTPGGATELHSRVQQLPFPDYWNDLEV